MSSPFSSALARLDESLQNVQMEIECLGAALEVNDDRLIHSLADARQYAARLRDMVREQRPDAHWEDRNALGRLVQELEGEIAAKVKRNQQRREKLLELADELEGGSVKHRFDTRSAALNALRLEAVRELRSDAAVGENVKALGGPDASGWLAWACGLLEGRDAAVLSELRRDFPDLERFAGEMEEGYWIPALRRAETRPPTSSLAGEEPASAAERSLPGAPQPPSQRIRQAAQPADSAPAEFYKISGTASYDASLSASYGRPASTEADTDSAGRVSLSTHEPSATSAGTNDEALIDSIAAAPHVKICDRCGGTFPATFQLCPFDGSSLQAFAERAPTAAVAAKRQGQAAAGALPITEAPAPKSQPIRTDYIAGTGLVVSDEPPVVHESESEYEYDRLKAILKLGSDDEAKFQLLDSGIPRRKLVIAFGTAAGAVLLCTVLVLAYRSSGVSVSKLGSTVLAAGANVAGIATTVVPDSDIQRNIEQKLALLKESTIQANVEQGAVTLVGQSSSKWEALHAESLASQTPGVKSVKDEVEIDNGSQNATTKKSHGKTRTEAKAKPVATAGN